MSLVPIRLWGGKRAGESGARTHAHTKRPYRFIVPPAVSDRGVFAWFRVIVGALVDFRVFTGFCAALRAGASFRGPKPENMKNVKI